jgi:uncharacterized membrane protein YqjE
MALNGCFGLTTLPTVNKVEAVIELASFDIAHRKLVLLGILMVVLLQLLLNIFSVFGHTQVD